MRDNTFYKTWYLLHICMLILVISCHPSKKDASPQKEENLVNHDQEWVTLLIKAYQTLHESRSLEAADLIFEASELMPKKNWENYLVASTIYAPKGKKEKAFTSIEKAIEAGLKDPELLKSLPDFSSLYDDSRWDSLITKTQRKRKEYLTSIQNPELLKEMEEMWAQDQLALSQYEENIKSLDSSATRDEYRLLFKPVKDRWEINKNRLDSIISIHGWPGNKIVGEDGAEISWAIAQHNPDIFFKQKCLILIKEAIQNGDTNPNHYAELTDRIARDTWQKQIYGASMSTDTPHPIEDPANVDNRRLKLGLHEPIEVYALYHGIKYKRPSVEEATLKLNASYEKAQENYSVFEKFASEKNADSANSYIVKSIAFHGDINNEQLYNAAIHLAKIGNKRSEQISLKILKVLIWRKWKNRFKITDQPEFSSLQGKSEWSEISELLQNSN